MAAAPANVFVGLVGTLTSATRSVPRLLDYVIGEHITHPISKIKYDRFGSILFYTFSDFFDRPWKPDN
jgi:hypothetical protein